MPSPGHTLGGPSAGSPSERNPARALVHFSWCARACRPSSG